MVVQLSCDDHVILEGGHVTQGRGVHSGLSLSRGTLGDG